jgi:hypothetical protein
MLKLSIGDIIIKRAVNGLVVLTPSNNEGLYNISDISVYEYKESSSEDVEEAEAIYSLLQDHFPNIFQTKNSGGMSISIHENGRAHSEETEG